MRLLEPLALGARMARNRLVFGPHVTNLADGRAYSARHVAYYRRRATGGCGTIVVEEASVHESDWPYERCPLATRAAEGWHRIAVACQAEGALVVAALGHAGGQGTSAYSQLPLWAPSRVPEVNTREVPKWMEAEDIAAVVDGFASAAKLAADAGCDGVEVNAGQHSLVRQFLSGLTNQRSDEWGTDRTRLALDVLAAAREGVGTDRVLGLRLACDELAPWAGITPERAPELAAALAELVDYVVVVRGSIYSAEKTRPDFHEPTGFNAELTRSIRAAVPARVAVVLQGSVVHAGQAEWALSEGVADAVEMTRAQLAEPDLAAKLAEPTLGPARPCIRCNQACQVRDARNPIVTCVGEPTSGHETGDPDWYVPAPEPRSVLVVGGGPAGLECARVAAIRGHRVHLVERAAAPGGVAAERGPGGPLVAWLAEECHRLGVNLETGRDVTAGDVAGAVAGGAAVVLATGSRPGVPDYAITPGAVVLDVLDAAARLATLPRPVVLWDPIGGPAAVALAEELGAGTTLVTPDAIAGNELSRTGDLAPANTRLQQIGVNIERRRLLREVRAGEVEVEHRWSGVRSVLLAATFVDCGHRLPDDALFEGTGRVHLRIGDAVAPRTILEAMLEGRRAALAL